MSALKRYREIVSDKKFQGWPLVGEYKLGPKIPFFGQVLEYTLKTGNGNEDYFSLIRHFGWCVVFGVTENGHVLTLVQWKPGVNRASWELPPGGIGKIDPGTGRAEIMERTKEIYLRETGYGLGNWEYLGRTMVETGKYRGAGPNDHGLSAHLMLAQGLVRQQGGRQPNRNEIMETLEVRLDEFKDVINSGCFEETSALPCALLSLIKLGKLEWS